MLDKTHTLVLCLLTLKISPAGADFYGTYQYSTVTNNTLKKRSSFPIACERKRIQEHLMVVCLLFSRVLKPTGTKGKLYVSNRRKEWGNPPPPLIINLDVPSKGFYSQIRRYRIKIYEL